ncbi:MAG: DUF1223 domain-containing protein [Acidimicrobiales bacterium]|nr:DUF1223 domain-containing protein [Hyphomonadaceae bacterium]RZV44820.1 MAG: DUF1223 domain-containing protein [Acidimicrobiales bacterium]
MKNISLVLVPSAFFLAGAFALAAPQAVLAAQVSTLEISQKNIALTYPKTVVELFTSQGCSSCPPSNKLVRDIADTDGLLALSYSVDYWDYLGWKDTHGSPTFSERQRDYGKRQFQGQVYTPQIILNGETHAARFKSDQITQHKLTEDKSGLVLHRNNAGLNVKAKGLAGTLIEVRYTAGTQSVPVARGENRGRTITLANVVTSVKTLGECDENKVFETVVPPPSDGEGLAILMQDGKGGPIITAANYTP